MATVAETITEQRVVLRNVSWDTYAALSAENENRNARLTYDRGELEIMTPSHFHEWSIGVLGRLIETYTEEQGIAIRTGRSTTFRRQDRERGLEPDESYYIQHESSVRGKRELDLSVDPPPDLVIEVDLSRPAIDKLPIYADFGVPEVWQFDGKVLRAFVLQRNGQYNEQTQSAAFPDLSLALLVQFLDRSSELDDTSLVREFRQWVRSGGA